MALWSYRVSDFGILKSYDAPLGGIIVTGNVILHFVYNGEDEE